MVALLALTAADVAARTISLAWDASADPVAGYRVYWSTQSGSFSEAEYFDVGNSLEWTGDLPGDQHYFVVRAYDEEGTLGPLSLEVGDTSAFWLTNPGDQLSDIGQVIDLPLIAHGASVTYSAEALPAALRDRPDQRPYCRHHRGAGHVSRDPRCDRPRLRRKRPRVECPVLLDHPHQFRADRDGPARPDDSRRRRRRVADLRRRSGWWHPRVFGEQSASGSCDPLHERDHQRHRLADCRRPVQRVGGRVGWRVRQQRGVRLANLARRRADDRSGHFCRRHRIVGHHGGVLHHGAAARS